MKWSFLLASSLFFVFGCKPRPLSVVASTESSVVTSCLPLNKLGVDLSRNTYDKQNALFFASLSCWSYENEDTFQKSSGLQELGFKVQRLFSSGQGTQAYVVQNNVWTLVVFRGTELNEKDFLTDLNYFTTPYLYGDVHRGFYRAGESVLNQVKNFIDSQNYAVETFPGQKASDNVLYYFSGHSLGGALAYLAAAHAKEKGRGVKAVYTFGAPRIGDESFLTGYNSKLFKETYSVANEDDLVPRVPPHIPVVSRNLFRPGQLIHLTRGNTVFHYSPGGEISIADFNVVKRAKHHKITNYLTNLKGESSKKLTAPQYEDRKAAILCSEPSWRGKCAPISAQGIFAASTLGSAKVPPDKDLRICLDGNIKKNCQILSPDRYETLNINTQQSFFTIEPIQYVVLFEKLNGEGKYVRFQDGVQKNFDVTKNGFLSIKSIKTHVFKSVKLCNSPDGTGKCLEIPGTVHFEKIPVEFANPKYVEIR